MGRKHPSWEDLYINIVKSLYALNKKYQAEFLFVNPGDWEAGFKLFPHWLVLHPMCLDQGPKDIREPVIYELSP